MKKYIIASFLLVSALALGSCGQEEINTEFSVTTAPLPLIPAKAVSCYSEQITGPNETPAQDVEESYFRIPFFKFWRANNTKSLIISYIRVTYSIPTTPGSMGESSSCTISGDNLRALSSLWWARGPEATINPGEGSAASPFQTDCAAYCGGIKTTVSNFTTGGAIEIFGLERDTNGDETPVKLQGYVTIQAF